ncbi:hypothetical protein LX36DRAFT_59201 [Colletotrichum falcatum]|nr:hypothetical protein LX36DRAFT_59201 [Colletotrichum falcatum]
MSRLYINTQLHPPLIELAFIDNILKARLLPRTSTTITKSYQHCETNPLPYIIEGPSTHQSPLLLLKVINIAKMCIPFRSKNDTNYGSSDYTPRPAMAYNSHNHNAGRNGGRKYGHSGGGHKPAYWGNIAGDFGGGYGHGGGCDGGGGSGGGCGGGGGDGGGGGGGGC